MTPSQTIGAARAGFTIVVPTWNNLDYLKLCVASIEENSAFPHEMVVHVNDGSDGSLDWVREKGLAHSHAADNLGVPLSVNLAAAQASRDWILYLNDDMWVCPGWDVRLVEEIERAGTDRIFLCSRLIEPKDTGDARVRVLDCGDGPANFDREKLLAHYADPGRGDERLVFSQPTLIHRLLWHAVGGYSVEFSPGMSSDDDLIMKLWMVGCREFRLVDASRVYHFACRSTGRIRKNRGSRMFLVKWGVRWKRFRDAVRSGSAAPTAASLGDRARRALYAFSGEQPLGDVAAWKSDLACDWTAHPARRDDPA
ncbi:MAG: glycosyltransferase family 2 protein [Hyphomicrobiales bacterium]|nr:glycosyltransferase family 2 protein [Hyphomicrobiales bacterium]